MELMSDLSKFLDDQSLSKAREWREENWRRGAGGRFGSYVGGQAQQPQEEQQAYGMGYAGQNAAQDYGQAQGPLQEDFSPAFPEMYGQEERQEPGEFEMPSPEQRDALNGADGGNLYLGDPPKPDASHKKALMVGVGALAAIGIGLAIKKHGKQTKFIQSMSQDAQAAAKEIGRLGNSPKAARFTRQIESRVFRSGDEGLKTAFRAMEDTGSLPPGRLSKARIAGLKGASKRQTIDNLANEFHDAGVEFSVIVSPGNNIRYASRGGKTWGFIDGADGIGKEMDRMRNYQYKGVYSLYHNHPDNSAFSAADLDTMGRMGFGEMYASNPNGTLHKMTASKNLMDQPSKYRMQTWQNDVMPSSGDVHPPDGYASSRGPATYKKTKIGGRTPKEAVGEAARAFPGGYRRGRERVSIKAHAKKKAKKMIFG